MAAGTYTVAPIGPAQGGAYTAWNAWGGATAGCDSSGANCAIGWMNWYRVQSSQFARIRAEDGILYSTPAAALANGVSAQFTLSSADTVYFFIFDTGPQDNVGGVSVLVTQVPEPGSLLLLLGAGVMMLAAAGQKPLRNDLAAPAV